MQGMAHYPARGQTGKPVLSGQTELNRLTGLKLINQLQALHLAGWPFG